MTDEILFSSKKLSGRVTAMINSTLLSCIPDKGLYRILNSIRNDSEYISI